MLPLKLKLSRKCSKSAGASFRFVTRWYDIRRFSVNDYPADDITITRNFYQLNNNVVNTDVPQTYTLPVGAKRYAVPVNGVEIGASRGQIEQNDYNN